MASSSGMQTISPQLKIAPSSIRCQRSFTNSPSKNKRSQESEHGQDKGMVRLLGTTDFGGKFWKNLRRSRTVWRGHSWRTEPLTLLFTKRVISVLSGAAMERRQRRILPIDTHT